jgi:hypothetical protein
MVVLRVVPEKLLPTVLLLGSSFLLFGFGIVVCCLCYTLHKSRITTTISTFIFRYSFIHVMLQFVFS